MTLTDNQGTTRLGGHLLAECLQASGITRCFGVPGESYLALLDGLYQLNGAVQFVCCRQEGGAAYMAEAHAKLTGKPGVCLVTRGPGACNAAIGVHTAMQNSTPMVLFIGQVATTSLQREGFQEIDYAQFFSGSCKQVIEINHAHRIAELSARAFSVALSGRPGPVVVVLPEDVLSDTTSAAPIGYTQVAPSQPQARETGQIEQLLQNAKRPLMLIGGSTWSNQARQQCAIFAANQQMAVVSAFRCHDLMDNHHACYVGHAGLAKPAYLTKLFQQADLIIALGARFGEITTDAYTLLPCPLPDQPLVHIHPDSNELGKVYQADLAMACHVEGFFDAAKNMKAPDKDPESTSNRRDTQWLTTARQQFLDDYQHPPIAMPVNMGQIMSYLQLSLPSDAILCNGAGNFARWPNRYFLYGEEARLLAPQSGAMGYGVPAAIAAQLEHPRRRVVCFTGDGDFQMNGQELSTAHAWGARPIILLLNNGCYGTIRMHQEAHFPDRQFGTDCANPDFVALAKSYGFHGARIDHADQFPDAFETAMAANSGSLIEIKLN